MKNKSNLQFNKTKFVILNSLFLALFVMMVGFVTIFATYNNNLAIINSARAMNEQYIIYKNKDSKGSAIESYFSKDQIADFAKTTNVVPQKLYQTSIVAKLGNSASLTFDKFIESAYNKHYNMKLYEGSSYPVAKTVEHKYEQILISDYYADKLLANGYKTSESSTVCKPTTYQDLFDYKYPVYCINAQGQPVTLQIVGVYKTNYKQYAKHDTNYDVNTLDYTINKYNKTYAYTTVYTSVGFSDRQVSTLKQIDYPINTKTNTNFVKSWDNISIITKDAAENHASYVKAFGFSNIAFNYNSLDEDEIILPLDIFNEYYMYNMTGIDGASLFNAQDSVEAFNIIKQGSTTWIKEHFDSLYVDISCDNNFNTPYSRYKVVGVSVAYSAGIKLDDQYVMMNTNEFYKFIKPVVFTQNILVVPTDHTNQEVFATFDYADDNNLVYQTAASKYATSQAGLLRKYGVFISVILMVACGVVFGYVFFKDNKNMLHQDKSNLTFVRCLRYNWWHNLIILGAGFVGALMFGIFVNFLLNVIINASLGHLIVDIMTTKLAFLIMFNAAIVVTVGEYIASAFYAIKHINDPEPVLETVEVEVEQIEENTIEQPVEETTQETTSTPIKRSRRQRRKYNQHLKEQQQKDEE